MGRPAHALADKRFGRLLVLHRDEADDGHRHPKWVCVCDCGQQTSKVGSALVRGDVRSCGCLQRDQPNHETHGMRHTPEYRAWTHMKGRCLTASDKEYKNYGGRGITICERWLNSFEAFFINVGKRPGKGYSLDRINVNGNYEPSNCRWATARIQALNTRRNKRYEVDGQQLCLVECAELAGVRSSNLLYHLDKDPTFDMESYIAKKRRPTEIKFKKLHPDAVLPKYAHGPTQDAGMDLVAVESVSLKQYTPTLIRTGLAMELPKYHEGQIRPRSGLALKHGITVWNSPGTVDGSFRGEIGVILFWAPLAEQWDRFLELRSSGGPLQFTYEINPGDRIAQMVIAKYRPTEPSWSEDLATSERGSAGFGSTGK